MTTPVVNEQFDTDFKTLNNDLAAYDKAVQARTDARNAYMSELGKIDSIEDPMKQMLALMVLLCVYAMAMYESDIGVYGTSLAVQGDITQCGNDLENITNSDDTTVGSSGSLAEVCEGLDEMLDLLSPENPDPTIRHAIDPTACDMLYNNLLTIRQDIYYAGDSEAHQKYNPTQVQTPPDSGPRTYHFEVVNDGGSSKYMTSYGEMQDDMSTQGDPKQANEAAKLKTDAFSTNTSTTQSTQAASQELISQLSTQMKSLQGFVTSGFKSMLEIERSATQNMSK